VYCRDLGFEPLRSDSLEADDYDERSIHCLVQSVSTGAYVGCARLVLTDADTPQTPLPVEVTCATLDRSLVEAMAHRSQIAEISRLANTAAGKVSKTGRSLSDFRHRNEAPPALSGPCRLPWDDLAGSPLRHHAGTTEPRLATNLALCASGSAAKYTTAACVFLH
jgi:hypothetical protein